MAQVFLSKPSKLNNLGYIFLGYFLSSILAIKLNLALEEQIAFTVAIGSFIGTLVYYIKPIERIISGYLKFKKGNMSHPEEPFGMDESPIYKSEIIYSNYLQDDRTIINGAFFLAIGMAFSYPYWERFGSIDFYWLFQVFTVVMIAVGFWETKVLIKIKLPIVVFFYNYYNLFKEIQMLENAIQTKDWVKAKKIIDKEPELTDPDILWRNAESSPSFGVCIQCEKIDKQKYCAQCGSEIRLTCKNCGQWLVRDEKQRAPKYCHRCGTLID